MLCTDLVGLQRTQPLGAGRGFRGRRQLSSEGEYVVMARIKRLVVRKRRDTVVVSAHLAAAHGRYRVGLVKELPAKDVKRVLTSAAFASELDASA